MSERIKRVLRKIPGYGAIKEKIKARFYPFSFYSIHQIRKIHAVPTKSSKLRLNLLITTLNKKAVFAGVQTAIHFFREFAKCINADTRIIVVSVPLETNKICLAGDYEVCDGITYRERSIVDLTDRSKPLAIGENDVFLATIWHSAYSIMELREWYRQEYGKEMKIVYLIQDFEPGFYAWSSQYLLAESTYRTSGEVAAVFNSFSLRDYFKMMGYHFPYEYAFTPKLDRRLREYLSSHNGDVKRKKQILIYGRPNNARNAFELIVMALDEWYAADPNANDWTILSAGYEMPDIKCPSGAIIHVVGKMSLEEYAKTMLESSIGISLMATPHPSYPPLEMAAFGVNVITNSFANKDLSSFSSNITSLDRCTVPDIVSALLKLTSEDLKHPVMTESNEYLDDSEIQWKVICEGIKRDFNL